MLEYVVFACGLAFTAAVSPGPLMAFLMSSVARKGWRKTLPACLAPLVSDAPIAALVLLFIGNISELMNRVLRGAGGIFLLYLAIMAYIRSGRRNEETEAENGPEPKTLVQAIVVNILNPNPYIGWSLVLGPALIEAWRLNPACGIALIASFYATLTLMLALLIMILGTTDLLGPKARRSLVHASAGVLGALGIYQIVLSIYK